MSVSTQRLCDAVLGFAEGCRAGKNPALIVTAGRNTGKTTRFRELTTQLRTLMPLTGVIAESTADKTSYSARSLITGQAELLMEESENPEPGDFIHGRYTVHQRRFDACIDGIVAAYDGQIIAIDEVGKIELKGKGWFRLITFARHCPLLITVREQFVEQVIDELLGKRSRIHLDKLSPAV